MKLDCHDHKNSEHDGGNSRKPGIDPGGRRQDQPHRAQDFDDADDCDEDTRHILDPGKPFPGHLITEGMDHAHDQEHQTQNGRKHPLQAVHTDGSFPLPGMRAELRAVLRLIYQSAKCTILHLVRQMRTLIAGRIDCR